MCTCAYIVTCCATSILWASRVAALALFCIWRLVATSEEPRRSFSSVAALCFARTWDDQRG